MQLAAASTFQHTDKEQQANAAHHLMDDIAMQYACSCMHVHVWSSKILNPTMTSIICLVAEALTQLG